MLSWAEWWIQSIASCEIGADIGIKCRGCNRRILLERREFERRVKGFISQGEQRLGVK
jgi:hypothetical protein